MYKSKLMSPGRSKACSVGVKAERLYGQSFFWILASIPEPNQKHDFEYYVITAGEMAKNVKKVHKLWLDEPGKKGQPHRDSTVRTVWAVVIPPYRSRFEWNIAQYKGAWHLIEEGLGEL
jgi:hypothetical protein